MFTLAQGITIGIAIAVPTISVGVQWGILRNATSRHQNNIDSLWDKKADKEVISSNFETVNVKISNLSADMAEIKGDIKTLLARRK